MNKEICFKKKKAKNYEVTVMPLPLDDLCPFVFRLDLSYRLYPSPFSNVSNEYVARYARS